MERILGIVPAAGEGTRLRPFTLTAPKHLISMLGKPMIQYPLEHLVSAGVGNIMLVVGYLGDLLKEALGDGSKIGARLGYVFQERRLGIAHAIHLAIEKTGFNGPLVVYLGDNLLRGGISGYIKRFLEEEYDAYVLLSRVKDPRRFGVAIIKDGKLTKLVEKPQVPPSNLVVIGIYFFRDPDLVKRAFSSLRPSWRGEYEITELIQWFINNGFRVGYDVVSGWWKDVGTPGGLLEALYLLLDEFQPRSEGEVLGEVVGRVYVDEGAVVEGHVYGPSYIGKRVHVGKNARIEHYVSIEEGARVLSGTVSRSLILEDSLVDVNSLRLSDSVVGKKAYLISKRELYGTIRATLSDYSKVEI